MRISLYLLPLLAALCYCSEVSFENCTRAQFEGQFTITANGTEESVIVPLENVKVNSSNSECGKKLALEVDGRLQWTLEFSGDNATAHMNQLVKFRPSDLFQNESMDLKLVPFSDKGTIDFARNKSYACLTPTTRSFEPGEDFMVKLDIDSVQVQAFDLPKSGEFSTAEHCSEDEPTTTPSESPTTTPSESPTTTPSESPTTTPEEPTTSPKEPTTSPEVPTTSPEVPTTTEPSSGVLTFRLMSKKNQTCILMEAKLDMEVTYATVDNKTATGQVTVPAKGYKVDGSCAEANASSAILKVSFHQDSLQFTFNDTKNRADISHISLEVYMDEKRFPNASAANKTVTFSTGEKASIALSNDTTFFVCKSRSPVDFDPQPDGVKATMGIADLKVQAFNFAGKNFSGSGEECSADTTTTPTPVTTPTPTPSIPPDTPNNYTVKNSATNVTCIVMRAVMNLTIPYNDTSGKMQNFSTDVPHDFNVTGDCTASASTQTMTITFFENWSLAFVFTSNVSKSVQATAVGAEEGSFALESIDLTYVLDDHFPDPAKPNTTKHVAVQVPKDGLKAPMGGSYMCNSVVDFATPGGVSLRTSSFQYMAFHNKTDSSFPENGVTECSQDLKDNSVVPIAVGAALAALVIIVLIAYLIGRRRSRRSGYESV